MGPLPSSRPRGGDQPAFRGAGPTRSRATRASSPREAPRRRQSVRAGPPASGAAWLPTRQHALSHPPALPCWTVLTSSARPRALEGGEPVRRTGGAKDPRTSSYWGAAETLSTPPSLDPARRRPRPKVTSTSPSAAGPPSGEPRLSFAAPAYSLFPGCRTALRSAMTSSSVVIDAGEDATLAVARYVASVVGGKARGSPRGSSAAAGCAEPLWGRRKGNALGRRGDDL